MINTSTLTFRIPEENVLLEAFQHSVNMNEWSVINITSESISYSRTIFSSFNDKPFLDKISRTKVILSINDAIGEIDNHLVRTGLDMAKKIVERQ